MTIPVSFDEVMMRRALELARRGLGRVEPNPSVGAVIVDDTSRTIGEGWHQEFGGPHAEIHALHAAGLAARGATLYVTLEPCCHFGKTPPCSRAIIAAGIRRVVVAMRDPASHVDGTGIRELCEAGIQVDVGLLESEASQLVAPFVRFMTQHRPWFHAKWAMTLDGKIASRTGHSQWISNESSRAVVHALRGRMDGILIGIGTAIADNPLLTARPTGTRLATRIVVDSHARLPLDSQLVQTGADAPVLVFVTPDSQQERCQLLRSRNVEVHQIDSDLSGHPDLQKIALELGRRNMTNVLIEGGSQLLGSFFDAQLIDEVHALIAPKLVGGASAPTPLSGLGLDLIPATSSIHEPQVEILDGDLYVHGLIKH